MTRSQRIDGGDAVRLLGNAIRKVRHFDRHGSGITPCCRDPGELMLQDALEYLAWGDTHNARKVMAVYDLWKKAGCAPWPYRPTKAGPQ